MDSPCYAFAALTHCAPDGVLRLATPMAELHGAAARAHDNPALRPLDGPPSTWQDDTPIFVEVVSVELPSTVPPIR